MLLTALSDMSLCRPDPQGLRLIPVLDGKGLLSHDFRGQASCRRQGPGSSLQGLGLIYQKG